MKHIEKTTYNICPYCDKREIMPYESVCSKCMKKIRKEEMSWDKTGILIKKQRPKQLLLPGFFFEI